MIRLNIRGNLMLLTDTPERGEFVKKLLATGHLQVLDKDTWYLDEDVQLFNYMLEFVDLKDKTKWRAPVGIGIRERLQGLAYEYRMIDLADAISRYPETASFLFTVKNDGTALLPELEAAGVYRFPMLKERLKNLGVANLSFKSWSVVFVDVIHTMNEYGYSVNSVINVGNGYLLMFKRD